MADPGASQDDGRRSPTISGTRWEVLQHLIGSDTASVLDIGCRGRELSRHVRTERYVGLDLAEPADVIASAADPLPFQSASFTCVVLADVLEHLENPHSALDEAMRVATQSVVVLLPNVYTLWLRLRYLGGRTMGKYEFGPAERVDRHRWLMNFDQARDFTRGRAARNRWRVDAEFAYYRAFRRPHARAAYTLARVLAGPNLWAWEYAARLTPDERAATGGLHGAGGASGEPPSPEQLAHHEDDDNDG